jgi:tetratricopeptide (TPR) repeat protein
MDSARPFRAFVSYCHADAAFAARLQRKLEGYRLPRRLADKVAPMPGQAQGRIGPIFRDRADLSAAEDLSTAVREAIAASSALVVVASPDAAASRWVALEIRLFRELHPKAPVLAALACGEPEAALPEALRTEGMEPLAADFRREGDGRRLAFLKIVAGLTGIPFDALVQRDAQRQLRRVTTITLGAAVLLVVMAGLLVAALRAQAEAERRRTDAEGIVQYMLTTLRDRLKRTGNLSVMSNVNERSLQYFDAQGPVVHLSDKSILLRAQILHALGEDEFARGDTEHAKRRFDEAFRTTREVVARNPSDPDALYAHAQSEYWLGYLAWNKVDLAGTRTHWESYLRTAAKLATAEPRTARSLMELGYSHGNLCELNMYNRAHVEAALAFCRSALGYEREALKLAPGNTDTNSRVQMSLANRLGWLADALTTSHRFDEARALRRQEAAIYETLRAREPASVELRDRVTWPEIGLAKIEIAEGRAPEGLTRLGVCLRDLDRLSDALPDNNIVIGERVRVNILIAKASRDAKRADWRAYRNRAAELLAAASLRGPDEGLKRNSRMLAKLDEKGR